MSLNSSAFGCRISFFSISGKLLYFRKGVFAHEINNAKEILEAQRNMVENTPFTSHGKNSLEFVKWSNHGNMVYFLEYANFNSLMIFQSVLLIHNANLCYRIDETKDRFQIVGQVGLDEHGFDEDVVLDKLQMLKVNNFRATKDRVVTSGVFSFLSGRWFPKGV